MYTCVPHVNLFLMNTYTYVCENVCVYIHLYAFCDCDFTCVYMCVCVCVFVLFVCCVYAAGGSKIHVERNISGRILGW